MDGGPSNARISAPAAHFVSNIFEVYRFLIATTKQQAQMYKVRLELLDAFSSLTPDLATRLAQYPAFTNLQELTSKGTAIANALGECDPFVNELAFCRVVDY